MFGALNRFISRLDSDGPSQSSKDGHGAWGFQVLRNKNLEIAIEPWYDFIIGINGRQVDNSDANLFATEVRNCAGSNVMLILWSAKGQRVRSLHVPVPAPSPTLGLTLQWNPLSTTEDVWHILEVIPDSPADLAGLLPYGDYIVGTPEGIVRGESGLGELVEDYLSRSLRLYVYNHEYGVTRLVTITPSKSWGGHGALGCVLGFGALHRLPLPLTEPPAAPGETMFETARFSNEENQSLSRPPQLLAEDSNFEDSSTQHSSNILIPASMALPPPAPPTTATSPGLPRSGRKNRHAASSNQAFDDYFKEGEQKSREEDFAPGAKATPPPPPPKASDRPPKAKSPELSVESEGEKATESQT